ncbi:hypothetical protein V6N11_013326 [Hibiscus sabdariffa]|uniref:Uncharacterized protein n=1 Tax=Hibiscus sabdariffa TaxID=183260 RepID=A0ABR2NMY7_9ROSI
MYRVSLSRFRALKLQKIKAELEEVSKNPERFILEAVHSAGYCGPLANPLLASETAIERLDSGILEEFVTLLKFVHSILKMVDEVTLQDITNMAKKIVSSPLTMASFGDGKYPKSR